MPERSFEAAFALGHRRLSGSPRKWFAGHGWLDHATGKKTSRRHKLDKLLRRGAGTLKRNETA
jgi:hypothetical protein